MELSVKFCSSINLSVSGDSFSRINIMKAFLNEKIEFLEPNMFPVPVLRTRQKAGTSGYMLLLFIL